MEDSDYLISGALPRHSLVGDPLHIPVYKSGEFALMQKSTRKGFLVGYSSHDIAFSGQGPLTGNSLVNALSRPIKKFVREGFLGMTTSTKKRRFGLFGIELVIEDFSETRFFVDELINQRLLEETDYETAFQKLGIFDIYKKILNQSRATDRLYRVTELGHGKVVLINSDNWREYLKRTYQLNLGNNGEMKKPLFILDI